MRSGRRSQSTRFFVRAIYENPVITAEMVPPTWRYDFNPATNPCFMERIGVNATLNSGAIKWNGKIKFHK